MTGMQLDNVFHLKNDPKEVTRSEVTNERAGLRKIKKGKK